ncbi:MAG: alpha-L-rhamnosidase [Spirochaetes bacterium]|nr:alpha-L-rhamnosidase [Spirochaetota bacterium]
MDIRRILVTEDPLRDKSEYRFETPAWPAFWVGPEHHEADTSAALVFRCTFTSAAAEKIRLHLSADQRYELYVDGLYAGRGSERSDLKHWIYESYELSSDPGEHMIVIRLWWIAASAPAAEAQLSYRPAILVYAEGAAHERISTGAAAWEYAVRPGYAFADFERNNQYFATGAQLSIDGTRTDGALDSGASGPWLRVKKVEKPALAYNCRESRPWWILQAAKLPPMYEASIHAGTVRHVEECADRNTAAIPVDPSKCLSDEMQKWQKLMAGDGAVVIPPHTSRRVIIDLNNYYCAYPVIDCSGAGASVRVNWAESLFMYDASASKRTSDKGHRGDVDGKCFFGFGFSFTAGPKQYAYQPHTFQAGRYVELHIVTGDNGLSLTSMSFIDTHFPYRFSAQFKSSRGELAPIVPIALRTLAMCSHDTSMDCPYYERLNYAGDTRLQSLVAYVSADEERLARKCMELFDYSRLPSGLTFSRYPTRTMQVIPPFSLWWIAMVHDFAVWRDDVTFVRERMLGTRAVLEHWLSCRAQNGLVSCPDGWNFVDWVPAWKAGIPSGGTSARGGFSSILALHLIYTLRKAAELETSYGEPLLAQRYLRDAAALAKSVRSHFYDDNTGLFADDLKHREYSEHAQCLAVLSGAVIGAAAKKLINRMLQQQELSRATIYFSHYLFEAFGAVGRADAILERLAIWETLPVKGFSTTFEAPGNTRSDCHAWGAHPVYHFFATIAGIRPDGFGFKRVIMRPQPGTLTAISGKMPVRRKHIAFDLSFIDGMSGTVTLPAGMNGELQYDGKRFPLAAGKNTFSPRRKRAKR